MTDPWLLFVRRRLTAVVNWTPSGECRCPGYQYKPNCPAFVYGWVQELRRIAGRHEPGVSDPKACGRCNDPWPCGDIAALAAIWAEHPNYPGK